jgi:hypothetical protein
LAAQTSLVLTHVNVVDVSLGGITPNVAVSIRGGSIDRIGFGLDPLPGVLVIDATGKFLMPGLWDMHVHLQDPESAFHALIANGIISARVMYSGLPVTEYEAWRSHTDAVRIAAAGMIQGADSPARPGAFAVHDGEEARLAVKLLVANRADFVEIASNVSREAYFAIADETRRLGASFAGVVPESLSPAEAADAGQLSVEGLGGVLRACSGPCDPEETLQLFEGFADNSTFQTPMLAALKYRGPLVRSMQHAGVHLLAGSDAGGATGLPLGESLHDELELLVESGLTPLEALQTATYNPALYFGTLALMGTVAQGKAADLLLLNANPLEDIRNTRRIQAVVMRGKYYSRDMLDAFAKKR